MDTLQTEDDKAARVQAGLLLIKDRMPGVYQSIKDKAENIGNEVYALVRKGLRGEADCFYAFECGYVVGTPFQKTGIMDAVAATMVQWGVKHVCIFADAPVAPELPVQTPAQAPAQGVAS